jgi:two-component system sensor histidine kinase PhoQ
MLSLTNRLLLASSAVLAGFLGVTGLVLDNAFRESAETALRDRLQGHVYALLAASDVDTQGMLHLPAELPDARFSQPASGLYAEVIDSLGKPLWQAKSMLGVSIPPTPMPTIGQRRFDEISTERGVALFSLAFTVSWESAAKQQRLYTYRVLENRNSVSAQIARFRQSLWGWLGAAALLLLVVQGVILRWSLGPLRRVADDVRAIEAGLAHRLHGTYPRELRHLTDNLNGLLESAELHLKRYRDSLGNLAHSLKTPLAVLRNAIDHEQDIGALRTLAGDQISAMTQLVEFQLHRAAAAGRTAMITPVAIQPVVENIIAALSKVYADKGVVVDLDVDQQAVFPGDAGDLTEMLGNLLDNAFKWCRQRVRIVIRMTMNQSDSIIDISVEDDGPGIPEPLKAAVLQRGVRADESAPGHGLGLAMVQDTVRLYQGEWRLGTGTLGGLQVNLRFTHRSVESLRP